MHTVRNSVVAVLAAALLSTITGPSQARPLKEGQTGGAPAASKPAEGAGAKAAASKPAAAASVDKSKLKTPAALNEKAPETFKARFVTSKGEFVVQVTRSWSPNGADRFYNLVKNGYFDDCRFFRVLANFMAQVGINGDPELNRAWQGASIPDDNVAPPARQSNTRGFVTYAKSALPNSRTTQIFFNYGNNSGLDGQGFTPFGKVVTGMEVLDKLYNEYGEGAPQGNGPEQGRLQAEGNAYLMKGFPKLDYIKTARLVK